MVTWSVKTSKKLPENFTHFYNTVYPNALSDNTWNLIVNTFSNSRRKQCPCSQMSYTIGAPGNFKSRPIIKYLSISRYIEHQYSQRECLNFNFSNFDFLENRKGIELVSKSLFNKDIKDLQPIEMAEILALYENPVKNNRNRSPERAKIRAEYLNDLYLKNLNK